MNTEESKKFALAIAWITEKKTDCSVRAISFEAAQEIKLIAESIGFEAQITGFGISGQLYQVFLSK